MAVRGFGAARGPWGARVVGGPDAGADRHRRAGPGTPAAAPSPSAVTGEGPGRRVGRERSGRRPGAGREADATGCGPGVTGRTALPDPRTRWVTAGAGRSKGVPPRIGT
ncbi:hypothetical protein Saso_63120 [Streptomyces asoensis]|uniref:Uncharacterized protein n=1 Tax=Streptomyces asoensis TaxID=249586 RepID=A0ABQ3S959_9ACTN|nr:hypothetical protein GCM10010496_39030 [Streptomyces asoensis]GHI64662.1 hypothetical protein Saso_63120 [Streptomyces asoensis]